MSSIKIQDGLPDIVAARFQEAKESGDLHAFDSKVAVLDMNGIPVTIPSLFPIVIPYPFLYSPSFLPLYYPSSLPMSRLVHTNTLSPRSFLYPSIRSFLSPIVPSSPKTKYPANFYPPVPTTLLPNSKIQTQLQRPQILLLNPRQPLPQPLPRPLRHRHRPLPPPRPQQIRPNPQPYHPRHQDLQAPNRPPRRRGPRSYLRPPRRLPSCRTPSLRLLQQRPALRR